MSEVKFTEEEMKQIKDIQDSYFDIQSEFGHLQLTRIKMDTKEKELIKTLGDIEKTEKNFLEKITKKYGEGSLDPETGVFNPTK